jgi:hypothetical protein
MRISILQCLHVGECWTAPGQPSLGRVSDGLGRVSDGTAEWSLASKTKALPI